MFEAIEPDGVLEAALVFKRSGVLLAAWTKHPAPENVLTVMAATLLGSVESIVETLGGPNPRTVFVAAEDRDIIASRVGPNTNLVLIGPRTAGELYLRTELRRLAARLRPAIFERHDEPSLSSTRT